MNFCVHFFFTAYKPVHYVNTPSYYICHWLAHIQIKYIWLKNSVQWLIWYKFLKYTCIGNTKFTRIKMNNMLRNLWAFNNRKFIWCKWVVLPHVKFVDLFWSVVANPDLIFISDVAAHWFYLWFECLYAVCVFCDTFVCSYGRYCSMSNR